MGPNKLGQEGVEEAPHLSSDASDRKPNGQTTRGRWGPIHAISRERG